MSPMKSEKQGPQVFGVLRHFSLPIELQLIVLLQFTLLRIELLVAIIFLLLSTESVWEAMSLVMRTCCWAELTGFTTTTLTAEEDA
jgi:hypothetical protein